MGQKFFQKRLSPRKDQQVCHVDATCTDTLQMGEKRGGGRVRITVRHKHAFSISVIPGRENHREPEDPLSFELVLMISVVLIT